MNCPTCAITKFREHIPEPMSMEVLRNIADQADEYGLSSFCISGGEPLSFPNLEEIIDTIDSSRFLLSMDTNGVFLNEKKIKWLVEKGVDRIHLSIDTHHASSKGGENLFKHNIALLPICKENALGVIINVVPNKDLIKSGELEKQLTNFEQYGFHVSMIFPKPVGSYENSKDQILDTKDINYLESLTKKYNCSTHLSPAHGMDLGCIAIKRHFTVLPNAQIMCCPWIPITFGSIIDEGLESIITRLLEMPHFSWDCKYTCHSGNTDSYFYQNIIPQIDEHNEYPVPYEKIDWHLEYFGKE